MLIVQFFDLLMINRKYIPHTTQKIMVTMAANFNSSHQGLEMSVTLCLSHALVLSSGIIFIFLFLFIYFFAKAHAISSWNYFKNFNVLFLYPDELWLPKTRSTILYIVT